MRTLLLIVATAALWACGPGSSPPSHSHAADAIIQQAGTPEERAELTRVRDEVDAAARVRLAELDAEIAELRRENEQLRQRKRSTN